MPATTSRRAVLAGAAAIPALSLPAIAQADPTFAAIERHRLAERAYVDAWKGIDPGLETEEAERLKQRAQKLGKESWKQYAALLQVTPTTTAGCAAALLYINQHTAEYGIGPFDNNADEIQKSGNEWLSRVAVVLQA